MCGEIWAIILLDRKRIGFAPWVVCLVAAPQKLVFPFFEIHWRGFKTFFFTENKPNTMLDQKVTAESY